MKLLVAVIQPEKLDEVKNGLDQAGIVGMTVSDVQGYGRQKGFTEYFHGVEYNINLRDKIKIEIYLADDRAEEAIRIITSLAKSGDHGVVGDGKIIVVPIEDCIRIRTGERGEKAL